MTRSSASDAPDPAGARRDGPADVATSGRADEADGAAVGRTTGPGAPVTDPGETSGDSPQGPTDVDGSDRIDTADTDADSVVAPDGVVARLTVWGRQRAEWAMDLSADLRERFHLVDTGFRIYERDLTAAGTVLGSAIALKLFLFFVPLLVLVVGLAGFFGGYVDADEVNDTAGIAGEMADQIRYAFNQPTATRWTALLAGLFGVLYTGRSLARALLISSSVAWQTGGRVSGKLRVIASVVAVIVGIAFVSVLLNRVRSETGVVLVPISFTTAFCIYLAMFAMLMVVLPKRTPDPGAALPGALITTVALVGMQAVSQFYLPNKLENASSLYGGIGIAIVSLGWFFILGRSLSLGFAVNAVLYEQYGSISQFVFGLPILRAIPKRSAWFRRYFGLDEMAVETPVEVSDTDAADAIRAIADPRDRSGTHPPEQ